MAEDAASVPLHMQVAEKLLDLFGSDLMEFAKPLHAYHDEIDPTPYNPTTGHRYRGINAVNLMHTEFRDPRWMTSRQAIAWGWSIKNGVQGKQIHYVKTKDLQFVRDTMGQILRGEDGRPLREEKKLDRAVLASAWVYNAEQINGIPPLRITYVIDFEQNFRLEELDKTIQAIGANIIHEKGTVPKYVLPEDTVYMPLPQEFPDAGSYFNSLIHELAHWTGHPSRLDRNLKEAFKIHGSIPYALEELYAEIAAMMAARELHIGYDPLNSAGYLETWTEILDADPFTIYEAAMEAERIYEYLFGDGQRKQRIGNPANSISQTHAERNLFRVDETRWEPDLRTSPTFSRKR